MPQLLYNGVKMDPSSVAVVAAKYANVFMEEVGGCKVPKGKRRKVYLGSAGDLFCFGDEGEEEWEDDWLVAGSEYSSAATSTGLAGDTVLPVASSKVVEDGMPSVTPVVTPAVKVGT
jgi:hypothetical protein